MERLTRERFDALLGSTRSPWIRLTGIEHDWYAEGAEKVLGVIVEDTSDRDYVCVVLGRDRIGRYRAVHLSNFFVAIEDARAAMPGLLTEFVARDPREFEQGDEPQRQIDFFTPVHPRERLNPTFIRLVEDERLSPARGIIEAMMCYFDDPDGNFVEQFQSVAFNARIWELYLFAILADDRSQIDRTYPAPDYLFRGVGGEGFIEAVTVNPNEAVGETGFPGSRVEVRRYLKNYVPIKFAGPLIAKLARRYWQQAHIGARPIILAIADFHVPDSMARSQDSLIAYLYGRWVTKKRDRIGRFICSGKIASHVWGAKQVPSGFFNLTDADNISAVISFGEDLIAKFNRMGMRAGFGSARLRMTVSAKRYLQHPTLGPPEQFEGDVMSSDYEEHWMDGMHVYHNPHALRPLSDFVFDAAFHHRLSDLRLGTIAIERSPFEITSRVEIRDEELR